MIRCPNCKTQLPDGTVFCIACHSMVDQDDTATPASPPSAPASARVAAKTPVKTLAAVKTQQKPRSTPLTIMLISAAVIVLAGVILLVLQLLR